MKHVTEALMGRRAAINVVAVSIEKPELVWVFLEKARVRSVSEAHLSPSKVGVLLPETLVATESGQA